MSVYDFSVDTREGGQLSLPAFKGKVLLIVNTASNCGLAPQFKGIQSLYEKYRAAGLEVLGFPSDQFAGQEPRADEEIGSYCQLHFGVTFPLMSKIEVRGKNAHPLFRYLTEQAPGFLGSKSVKWNFTKFLIDRGGQVRRRYSPWTKPADMEEDIKKLLAE